VGAGNWRSTGQSGTEFTQTVAAKVGDPRMVGLVERDSVGVVQPAARAGDRRSARSKCAHGVAVIARDPGTAVNINGNARWVVQPRRERRILVRHAVGIEFA